MPRSTLDPRLDAESSVDQTKLPRLTFSQWVQSRKWPLVATLAIVITGLAYSFWYGVLINHVNTWLTPGDIWSTFRDAHYVGWGAEGKIYRAETGLVTFPGIAVLLAPLAMLQSPLHLTASFPFYLAHPSEWYLLGPVELLLGGFVLFPLDELAKHLGISSRRRFVLVWLEAAVAWPVVAIWGHPEDTIAIALAVYGLLATFKKSWLHAGFFFGLAVAFQPLVLLILPVAFALIPLRRWPLVTGIITVPSVLLLFAPLVQRWGPTTLAIFKQPDQPSVNHATPWLAFATKFKPTSITTQFILKQYRFSNGATSAQLVPEKSGTIQLVAAGPERMIALVLAIVLGVFLVRRAPSVHRLVWFVAVALSLRCVFDAVLTPYYMFPALAIALIVAFQAQWWRTALVVAVGAFCTRVSYLHTSEWRYYLMTVGSLILAVLLAYPTRQPAAPDTSLDSPDQPSQDTQETSTGLLDSIERM